MQNSLVGSPVASTSRNVAPVSRMEAGPLPLKRGEIGYQANLHARYEESSRSDEAVVLPARHPADHDSIQSPAPARIAPERSSHVSSQHPSSPVTETASEPKPQRAKAILRFWKSRRLVRGGFQLNTAILFLVQLFFTQATIAGWALSVYFLQKQKGIDGQASSIFIHVLFGVLVLAQLLFLERRLFRLRAERYMHLHPGEVLPTSRSASRRIISSSNIAFSPWNRPPLPTYAAALAESGVGTGDVEDHLIAAAPPPAYGHTRGSTLLLRGFMAPGEERPVSMGSRPVSYRSRVESRPVSYQSGVESTEDDSHIAGDAEAARRLETRLDALERLHSRRERRREGL